MRRMLLEVIVQSVSDAREAFHGGADRLEVVRAIRDGGLTPPISLVRAIAAETSLPLRVMVRQNAGFETDMRELPVLRRAAAEFAAAGVDGIVLGFAHEGEASLDEVDRVLQAAPSVRVTFHRAFDTLRDPLHTIDELVRVPQVDRILTSGGDVPAAARCERLREYTARAGSGLRIVAGGGIDEDTLALFARVECVREVHIGRAARERADAEGPVSAARVKRLREMVG